MENSIKSNLKLIRYTHKCYAAKCSGFSKFDKVFDLRFPGGVSSIVKYQKIYLQLEHMDSLNTQSTYQGFVRYKSQMISFSFVEKSRSNELTKSPYPRSKIYQGVRWISIELLKGHISPLNVHDYARVISCYEKVNKVTRFARASTETAVDESKRSSKARSKLDKGKSLVQKYSKVQGDLFKSYLIIQGFIYKKEKGNYQFILSKDIY